MKYKKRIYFLFFIFFITVFSNAQEGGPPMLTDDARVADFKEWEMNVSFNSSITKEIELSVPHIDLNYGILPNLQLKAEAPLMLLVNKENKKTSNLRVGEAIVGVKYRFLDEEKHFVSAATFPQYSFIENEGFLIPVFLEKTLGNFLTGISIGYFTGQNGNHVEIGGLVGMHLSDKFDFMLEYFSTDVSFEKGRKSAGYLNAGFRRELTESLFLMGSFGTQVLSDNANREYFISWLGLRILF